MLLSRRSWMIARRYAGPPLALGAALAAARRWRGALPVLAFGCAVLLFFRDPARRCDPDPDTAYAVADGYITSVENVSVPWMAGPQARYSTFLGLQNVHVPRAPFAGVLGSWQWRDGKCRAALSARAAEENRQARLLILTPGGDRAGVILTSGLIARRITAWVRPGDKLGTGDDGGMTRLGLIHFGSSAHLLLGPGWVPLVRPGMRVRAGITPVAKRAAREPGRP